jgi:hypothetical protein
MVHGRRGALGIVTAGRAHFDEDETSSVQGDEIEFAMRAGVIASQDAVAKATQKTSGGALGTCAEPAPPPRFHDALLKEERTTETQRHREDKKK